MSSVCIPPLACFLIRAFVLDKWNNIEHLFIVWQAVHKNNNKKTIIIIINKYILYIPVCGIPFYILPLTSSTTVQMEPQDTYTFPLHS